MNLISRKWRDVSIRFKFLIPLAALLAVLWGMIIAVVLQLEVFSRRSGVIMNGYMEITAFLDAFSAENVCLEAYMRPAIFNMEMTYREAIAETDRQLELLRPDGSADTQEEHALKWAICGAMEHYRGSQAQLMAVGKEGDRIPQYLSLKRQAAYIDDYTRDLLRLQMDHGSAPWRTIADTNRRAGRFFLALMLAATALLLLVLAVFNRSLLRPIRKLGQAADRICTAQYDAPPLEVRGGDELGRTARSFNLMQTEIRRTIHAMERQSEMEKHLLEKEVESARMQRMLQEGRFSQLQSQINPHFLFNTLSTIAALAREEGAPLSEDLILRLSNFFRYSLESDEKMVTLEREIQLLRDYMELQETRYGGRITMHVQADPELGQVMVPKFILQPLVENAILHGLKACSGGGEIRVRTRRGRHGVTSTVTDNGCGFDTKQTRETGERRSVGLANIAKARHDAMQQVLVDI